MRAKLSLLAAALSIAPALVAQGAFAYYGAACGAGLSTECVTANTLGAVTGNFGLPVRFAIAANTGAIARTICGLELFCYLASGTTANMDVVIYDATGAGGGPGAVLRSALMPVHGSVGWHHADFAPLTLGPGTAFYVGFDNAVALRLPQMRLGAPVTHYYNGPAWLGPYANANWNYKVICCGAGTPFISNTGVPTINATFSMDLSAAPPSLPALLALGGLRAAVDLTAIGAPGCVLHNDAGVLLATSTDVNGDASIPIPLPNDTGLVGITFFAQYIVAAPGANTAGLLFTSGAEGRIGI